MPNVREKNLLKKITAEAKSSQFINLAKYTQAIAMSLIDYARTDGFFAQEFKSLVDALPVRSTKVEPFTFLADRKILLPADQLVARQRAKWLVKRLREKTFANSDACIYLLKKSLAVKNQPDPKALVIGIVGLAIPGITLGLIKTRRRAVSVIVNQGWWQNDYKFATEISQAGLKIFAQSLNLVNNDIKKIEPEISEWFWHDREFVFYQASGSQILQIRSALEQLGIVNEIVQTSGILKFLAISPVINPALQQALWRLQPIKN